MSDKTNKPSMNWEMKDLNKEWKRFKQHCEFTFKGPLASKTELEKVNYLMTYIGDKGREIYSTFTWAPAVEDQPAENETLEGVYNKYSQYTEPKRDEIRATVNFNRRRQQETEKFDNFVTDLRLLVADCGYTDPDRQLRDAIILRSLPAICEKCIEKSKNLTLANAINVGQSYEASRENMKAITDEDPKVNLVYKKSKDRSQKRDGDRKPKKRYEKGHQKYVRNKTDEDKNCGRCGYPKSHKTCPAISNKCNNCHKLGHFGKVCHSGRKAVNVVQDSEYTDDESDEEFLHTINEIGGGNENEWWLNITINGVQHRSQIDTGAATSIMPYSVFKQIGKPKELNPTVKKFKSYTGHELPVDGCVTLRTEYKDKAVNVPYTVVRSNRGILLSGDISKQLGVIERINTVEGIEMFPELKTTTGNLPGTYSLKIDPTVPPVVHGPRRQPKALASRIAEKLKEMEEAGQITKVTEPTDWVSSMVVVVNAKKNSIRLCLDPKDLNTAIRREHYPIPTVEEVLSSFPKAKVMSVLDAKSGFLQIKLTYESSLLTTFNTPIGRYRWLRLPFGVKSAPEVFQRIMDNMLEGITGARAIMDDILIGGKDEQEHDKILKKVVRRATEYNLRLNFDKCQIRKSEVKYSGHIVTKDGLKPDPDKVKALTEMPAPKSKEEIRRFLGLIQYLSKFIPNLSEIDAPLREVMKKDTDFHWDNPQQRSFTELKKLCSSAPVLAAYDVNRDITIQCDASSYALGGVLLQNGRPIAYTSRALTQTEMRYAQIEKETLAIVHSCKKFHYYIFGKPVTVESDHKPLQSIFSKPLLSAPMRLQSMMLRLQAYDLKVTYVPGKDIPIGDALSRANLPVTEPDMPPILVNMIEYISITPERYEEFQKCTAEELNELHSIIMKGWPDTRQETPHSIREFWNVRDELSVSDGIIYKAQKIVVPPSMRADMLKKIHATHMGITKCKQRAREALFWPRMSQQIEDLVNDCNLCNTYQNKQSSEPMKSTPTPDYPWCEIASDIFEFKGIHYLLTVDYYSKYIEVDHLSNLSSAQTINVLKQQICRHGIPEILRTDNGPQFAAREFEIFTKEYDIRHKTSSPTYAQSNGEAERAVQTVKRLWSKCSDFQLALLDYRTTPLESCGLSPSHLSMNRRLRNKLPISRDLLKPEAIDHSEVKKRLNSGKQKQSDYYNNKSSKDLPVLLPGDPVRMSPLPGTKNWIPAKVLSHHNSPRSYVVEYNGKKYRRNRKHLRLSTHKAHDSSSHTTTNDFHVRELPDPIPTSLPTSQPERNIPTTIKQPQYKPVESSAASPQRNEKTSLTDPKPSSHNTPMTTRSGRVIKRPARYEQ